MTDKLYILKEIPPEAENPFLEPELYYSGIQTERQRWLSIIKKVDIDQLEEKYKGMIPCKNPKRCDDWLKSCAGCEFLLKFSKFLEEKLES